MPTTRDYYEVLSIERTADGEEIKRAYRRMAMKYHPDRNPGDAEAETRFKECAEAYEVLSDERKKQVYDQYGHEGLRGAAGGGAAHDFSRMNVDDIFSMFADIFGGGGRAGGARGGAGARRGPARGYDLETEVVVTLNEVLDGCERDIDFTRMDVCETCTGSGAKPGTTPAKCATCGGQGQVIQTGMGGMFRMQTTCPTCKGRGATITDKCESCKGRGRIGKKRRLSVSIPAGIRDGQAVRISGEGEPPPPEVSPEGQGMRGDLHVVVRVKQHEIFQRDGDHLAMQLPLHFSQVALGAEIDVPTLAGPAKLTVKPGTQHGEMIRLKGQGLPNLRSGTRGDLGVFIKVEVPKKLTDEQKRILRELAGTENVQSLEPESKSMWDRIRKFIGGDGAADGKPEHRRERGS